MIVKKPIIVYFVLGTVIKFFSETKWSTRYYN